MGNPGKRFRVAFSFAEVKGGFVASPFVFGNRTL